MAANDGANYKVVAVVLFDRDLYLLEKLVARLKADGAAKANRSQAIRLAIAGLAAKLGIVEEQ